jgi:predicted Zn-dependent peptidase
MLMRDEKHRLLPAALVAVALLLVPLAVAAQMTKAHEIEYPPLPAFDVPQPTRVELDNGMVLILVEDHELPLIDAVARIRTGERVDPADQAGLASLTGDVMRTGGTETMTGDEIDEFLEGRGASIETGIQVDVGVASMSSLEEDFAEVLGIFAEILRRPVFDEGKLEVAKNQANTSIARQNDSPQAILFREFSKVLLGEDSPYTRPNTYTSIAGITREDLRAFHGRYFQPNNIVFGIVGDFATEEIVGQVKAVFGDWPAGPAAERFEGGYRTEPSPGVVYVEKNDMTQSMMVMGHLGVRRDSPDFFAIEIFNEVLGGGFSSRLFSRVRSQKGLAYAVGGSLGSNWDREGRFQLFTTTKTETTGAAIDALMLEARNIASDEPPTEAEVAKAKQVILSSFVFTSDSPREILGQQLTYEYYGYPLDWLARYIDAIRAVTTEQVQEVGRRYVKPESFSIVVVGPAEGRDRPLEDFGPVTVVDISIPELETAAVEATPEALARGRELVTAAIEAHGGVEILAGFLNIRQKASALATSPGGQLQVEIEQVVVYPDRLRRAVSLPQGTMVQVVTPKGSFIQTPAGSQPLVGERRDSLAAGLHRTLPVFLRRATEGEVEAAAGASGEVDGVPVQFVQIESGGESFRLGVDTESGRILELVFRGSNFAGAPGEVRQVFSDFREVQGLILPFGVEATFEGSPYMSSTISEATVNGEIDEALFAPPAQ